MLAGVDSVNDEPEKKKTVVWDKDFPPDYFILFQFTTIVVTTRVHATH